MVSSRGDGRSQLLSIPFLPPSACPERLAAAPTENTRGARSRRVQGSRRHAKQEEVRKHWQDPVQRSASHRIATHSKHGPVAQAQVEQPRGRRRAHSRAARRGGKRASVGVQGEAAHGQGVSWRRVVHAVSVHAVLLHAAPPYISRHAGLDGRVQSLILLAYSPSSSLAPERIARLDRPRSSSSRMEQQSLSPESRSPRQKASAGTPSPWLLMPWAPRGCADVPAHLSLRTA